MFKAVFVDDEIWALKGLSKMFDWESLGFRVVGEFTKSTEALKVILENKPDVVFDGEEALKMMDENKYKDRHNTLF